MTTPLLSSVQDVYQAMQRLAPDGDICCISYNRLTQKSGYCKSTVIKAIKELCYQKLIIKHTHNSGQTVNQTNQYQLLKSPN
jgi:CTP-dependent riboflavin kinase